jgi:uncharacterized membrane protein
MGVGGLAGGFAESTRELERLAAGGGTDGPAICVDVDVVTYAVAVCILAASSPVHSVPGGLRRTGEATS